MSKLNETVCRVMKLDLAPNELNYYSILKLPTFCDSREKVAEALQESVRVLKEAAIATTPDDLASVKRVLQQCNTVLLNKDKKAQYDQLLSKQLNADMPARKSSGAIPAPMRTEKAFSSSGPSVLTPAETEIVDPFEATLPEGNPHEEFSMRDYLLSAQPSEPHESPESRWEQLQLLQQGSGRTDFVSSRVTATARSLTGERSSAPTSGQSIQQRIRRKKAIRNALTLGVLTLVFLGLAGFAAFKFMQIGKTKVVDNKRGTIQAPATAANATTTANQTSEPEPALNVRMNGMPKPSNSPEQGLELPSVSDNTSSTGNFFTNDNAALNADDSSDPNIGMNESDTETQMPVDDDISMMSSQVDGPAPIESSDPEAFAKLVTQARRSIAQKDFAKFDESINTLLALPNLTEEQSTQRTSLDQTGQLYKIAVDSYESEMGKLKSGVALSVDDDDAINFVEDKGNSLVFRVRGKNETYAKNELPLLLTEAILNLDLTKKDPTDLAARGVFLKMYSDAAEFQSKGDEYLAQAAARNSKYKNIDDLSSDDYRP